MSSAGKRSERRPFDNYVTPAWCVHRLLDVLPLTRMAWSGQWLDPCAGDGAIIRAVTEVTFSFRSEWSAYEIRDCIENLRGFARRVRICDFLETTPRDGFGCMDVCMFNPPYDKAMEFVQRAMLHAPVVIALVRQGWFGSAERAQWHQAHPCSRYDIPDRPSFTNDGKTDSDYYTWAVWEDGVPPRAPVMLATTPLAERKGT